MGWAWKFAESVFLERNWDKDKNTIGVQVRELAEYPEPMVVSIFNYYHKLVSMYVRTIITNHCNTSQFLRVEQLMALACSCEPYLGSPKCGSVEFHNQLKKEV